MRLLYRAAGNQVFAELPEPMLSGLLADGFSFYRWDGACGATVRLVTAFNTRADDVEAFIEAAGRHGAGDAQKIIGAQ